MGEREVQQSSSGREVIGTDDTLEAESSASFTVLAISREQALLRIKEVLDSYRVPFWLAWGTCLGAVRDGELIPWDEDMDLGSIALPLAFPEREPIRKALSAEGFLSAWQVKPVADIWGSLTMLTIWQVAVEMKLLTMHSAQWKIGVANVAASLNFYQRVESIQGEEGHVFPLKLFTDPKEITFLGEKFYVPNPPEEYLRLCYGKNWRIPIKEGWREEWRRNP